MNRIKIALVILFTIALNFESAFAIPAFARKYNMSCKTCHSPFPKLKPYGDEFAGNGFVLADKDAPRYYMDTGDQELSLIRDLPLALRLEGYVTYNNSKSERSDFQTPYLLKLLSGGAITQNVSYYFYFFFSERGDVAGIEDAFIMFNNLFGSELDLYLGQFQVSDPLFKRELRLPFEDYDIYKTKVGNSGLDLTYDRGLMLTYGFETGTNIVIEILNGNGIGAADNLKNFDKDKYKNLFGRVSQDIIENLRIGACGYWGKEENTNLVNEVQMFGPDLTIDVEPFELNVQYLYRSDKDPFFLGSSAKEIKTKGGFAELILRPEGDNSKVYAVGLFNYIESDQSALNKKSGALHLGYLLHRNIRLVAEYGYNFTDKYGRIGLGFISAF